LNTKGECQMYIFAQHGILSIIAHESNRRMLMVRAPMGNDIEHFWPTARVIRTDTRDYRYRVMLPREAVAKRIAEAVAGIDYGMVKSSVSADREFT
jgi:hypothetical protein